MTEEQFWSLTANIDQAALVAGDEEGAIAPLRNALSLLTVPEIQSYEDVLSRLLFQIDGEDYARNAGESGNSADGFLYCRCYVVARGKGFYERALADPSAMPQRVEQWLEPLLFVASDAWAAVTGRDPESWDRAQGVSYETGSNVSLWPSLSGSQGTAACEDADFVEPDFRRAVSRAGHAYRAKRYRNVVSLLAPHEPQLSKKQRRMLNDARTLEARQQDRPSG